MISCAAHKFWAWQSALLSQCGPGALGSKVEIGRVATVLDTAWSSQTKSNKCARTFEDYRLLWVKLVMSRLSLAEAELIEWVFTLTNLHRVWPFETFTSMLFWCHLPCWSGSVVLVWRPASDGFTQRVWPPVASRSRRSIVSDCWMGTKRFWPRNEEILGGKFGWWIEDNWGFILSVKPSMIQATTKWQWTWSSWQWSQNWLDFSCCWFTICFLMKEVTWSH